MKMIIRSPKTEKEFKNYYQLRWKILREPWNQPKGTEKDDLERDAFHVMAYDNSKIIGVGRLQLNSNDEAQIRYMAVEENYRGKGIGSLILKELEKKAKLLGAKYIILNSRINAIKFYEKNSYKIIKKESTLFGSIEHWRMRKNLA
jgi:N-acetylglutamate synthase-like GNAT family acetyltransferase